MNKLILLLAVLPGLYMVYYVYKLDRIEKEPRGLLVKLMIYGAISVVGAVFLETISLNMLGMILYSGSIIYIFFECLFVGFIEEGLKFVFLYLGSWRHKEFNYVFDGIVYAVCVSLGFAIVENVMYGMSYGLSTVLLRAVTSIPYHAIFSIFMGQYYGLAKWEKVHGHSKGSLLLAFIVPVLIHALYDFGASIEYFGLLFFIWVFIFEWICFKKLKKLAVMDKQI